MKHHILLHTALILLTGLVGSALQAKESIELQHPSGGWRSGTDNADGYLQEINYPANSVSAAPDQGKESLSVGVGLAGFFIGCHLQYAGCAD